MANHEGRRTWCTPTPSRAAPGSSERRGRADDDGSVDLELGRKDPTEVALKTSPWGRTAAAEVGHRLELLGLGGNVLLDANKESKTTKILGFLPLVVEAAAAVAMAVGLARGGWCGDGAFIVSTVSLVAADLAVDLVEGYIAGNATAAALVARLAPPPRTCRLLRGGVWSEQDAAVLVPGDVIRIRPGDAVPADARLLTPQVVMITGHRPPATNNPGDAVYAGSASAHGEAEAVVLDTGAHTYLCHAARLADTTEGDPEAQLVYWMLKWAWNAGVVATCFRVVVDIVAGHVVFYGFMLGIALILGLAGWMLCHETLSPSHHWRQLRRRRERDPEELMRGLEDLRRHGGISEETLRRCRDLFGAEPVSRELVAKLANHFGWVMPDAGHHLEDRGDGRAAA
ncbi:hypothetical protein ACQJBY_047197 [Aegilops geniculata]